MRLIDADNFKKDFCAYCGETICNGYCDEMDIINQQPTVEAEPVRHGRWEYIDAPMFGNPYGSYKCDCGNSMPHKTNYCPHCGAKMDGGDL